MNVKLPRTTLCSSALPFASPHVRSRARASEISVAVAALQGFGGPDRCSASIHEAPFPS